VCATSRIPHLAAVGTAPIATRVCTLRGRHDCRRSAGWTRLGRVSNSARARVRSMIGEIELCHRRLPQKMALERLVTGLATGLRKAGNAGTTTIIRRRRRPGTHSAQFRRSRTPARAGVLVAMVG
jgi:hypothetical protein